MNNFLEYLNGTFDCGEKPEEMLYRLYPVGAKFNILEDKDPWYIVKYVEDDIKIKDLPRLLVIYKSWNKYKQHWNYKTMEAGSFLFEQHLLADISDLRKNIPMKKDKMYKKIMSYKEK